MRRAAPRRPLLPARSRQLPGACSMPPRRFSLCSRRATPFPRPSFARRWHAPSARAMLPVRGTGRRLMTRARPRRSCCFAATAARLRRKTARRNACLRCGSGLPPAFPPRRGARRKASHSSNSRRLCRSPLSRRSRPQSMPETACSNPRPGQACSRSTPNLPGRASRSTSWPAVAPSFSSYCFPPCRSRVMMARRSTTVSTLLSSRTSSS